MKRIPAVVFAFFIIILTSACSAKPAPAAIAQAPVVTITPLIIATLPPTLTQTSTTAPTQTPTPSSTSTPILPTPTPTIGYAKECISIEDQLPADLDLDGALMLYGGRYASDWNNTVFHFNLMSQRRSPLPSSASEFSLSPDGRWLAYISESYDEHGRRNNRFLRVTNAEGRHLDLSYWGINWQYLMGWQDEQRVLLYVPGNAGGNHIILNPFTGEREIVDVQVPDHLKGHPTEVYLWNNPNPQLSHWLVWSRGKNPRWELMDEDWNTVWAAKWTRGSVGLGDWSPNGKFFTLVESTISGYQPIELMLVRVDLHGKVQQLTSTIGEGENLSWSPDSHYLSGWLQLDPHATGYTFPNDLVLIDAEKPQVTDLCFQNAVTTTGWVDNTAPIWSPDGRFVALAVSRIEERANSRYTSEVLIWDTAIIDLQARRGYLLAKDARPQAWMRKP